VLAWKLGDLLEWSGLGKHRWRERIGTSAFDPPVAEPAESETASIEAVIV